MSKLCKHSRFQYWRHFVYTTLLIWYKITVVLLKPCCISTDIEESGSAAWLQLRPFQENESLF
jgi:hypothetical protein